MASRYDKRLDKLEEKLGAAGQLPKDKRGPYFGWGDDAEASFKPIRERLMAEFGTTTGAQFLRLSWGTPEAKNAVI